MDFTLALENINVAAVVSAAIASMILGSIWYARGALGNAWMKAAGLSDKDVKNSNMTRVMTLAFIKTLITAFVLALVMFEVDGIVDGATTGAVIGAGLVAAQMGVLYLFEQRPKNLWLINGSFVVANFTLMGTVIAWLT